MIPQLPMRTLGNALLLLILSANTITSQTLSKETSPGSESSKEDSYKTEIDKDSNQTPRQVEFKRWGLSLHGGVGFPHGDLNTVFNPGPNVGADLEYRFKPRFSLEGIYTYHRFSGGTFGPVSVDDLNLHQLSINGKVYGSTSPVRPFFNFGGGAYKFDPGSTHGGLNTGGGVQFDATPTVAIDVMYNFHNVFTSGQQTRFSTTQGGVRFRF